METLKFLVVLLVVVFVQVFGALGTPLSNEEEDGEVWTLENWQVKNIFRDVSRDYFRECLWIVSVLQINRVFLHVLL